MSAKEIAVLHEPLNYELGVHGVPCWYPSSVMEGIGSLVQAILELRVAYKRGVFLRGESTSRSLARLVFGGQGARSLIVARWKRFRYRERFRLCIKDPFALLLSGIFSQYGIRSVVMVRHPAALYRSMKRMEWRFDFSHLATSLSSMDDSLVSGLDPRLFSGQTFDLPEQVGLLWKTLYFVAFEQARGDGNVLFVRHEDFCLRPIETMKEILNHLGLGWSRELDRSLKELTSSGSSEVEGKQLHRMKRNSAKLAVAWKKHAFDEDVKKLQWMVGQEINLFYSSWDEL